MSVLKQSPVSLPAAHARGVLGPLLVLIGLATPALADKYDKNDKSDKHHWQDKYDKHDRYDKSSKHGHHPPPIGAPEIDPGSVLGGLTLLVGGTFILADRRCRTKPELAAD